MSEECKKCNKHALECKCKGKPWKPEHYIACPTCDDFLFITSLIQLNGQVNFACMNNDCPTSGFICSGKFYFCDGTWYFCYSIPIQPKGWICQTNAKSAARKCCAK